jgi:hypothetical protein
MKSNGFLPVRRLLGNDLRSSRDILLSRAFLNSASIRGNVILQQLTDRQPEDFYLPWLKDDKAIGVADVDAPEERGWQQPI